MHCCLPAFEMLSMSLHSALLYKQVTRRTPYHFTFVSFKVVSALMQAGGFIFATGSMPIVTPV